MRYIKLAQMLQTNFSAMEQFLKGTVLFYNGDGRLTWPIVKRDDLLQRCQKKYRQEDHYE